MILTHTKQSLQPPPHFSPPLYYVPGKLFSLQCFLLIISQRASPPPQPPLPSPTEQLSARLLVTSSIQCLLSPCLLSENSSPGLSGIPRGPCRHDTSSGPCSETPGCPGHRNRAFPFAPPPRHFSLWGMDGQMCQQPYKSSAPPKSWGLSCGATHCAQLISGPGHGDRGN